METKVPIYTRSAKFVHGKQSAIEILDGDNKYRENDSDDEMDRHDRENYFNYIL